MITEMEKFRMQYCVDKLLEEIESRQEVMKKLFNHETPDWRELYGLRESLVNSHALTDMLRADLDRLAVEKPKSWKSRIFGTR